MDEPQAKTVVPPTRAASAISLGLAAIALLSLVSGLVVLALQISSAQTLGIEIQTAGRQRSLVERLTRQTLLKGTDPQAFSRTVFLLQSTAQVLLDGGALYSDFELSETNVVPAATSPEGRAAFQLMARDIDALIELSRAYQAGKMTDADAQQQILTAGQRALETSQHSVRMLEGAALAGAQENLRLVLALIVAAVVCGLLSGFASLRAAASLRAETGRVRQARQRAAAKAAQLNAVIETAANAIITIDAARSVLSFNPAAERLLGYSAAQVVGQPLALLFPGSLQQQQVFLARALDSNEQAVAAQSHEAEARRQDGSIVLVELAMCPFQIGDARFVTGILHDMSERKERDGFFNISLDLLCIAHADGYFKRLNPAFPRTLGYSERELLERPFISFVHPDDLEATQAVVAGLAQGIPSVSFNNRYRCQDGSYISLRWMASSDPATGTLYATARDVTETLRLEEELRATNRRLKKSALFDRCESKVMAIFSRRGEFKELLPDVLALLAQELELYPSSVHLHNEWRGTLELAAAHGMPEDYSRSFSFGEGLVGEAAARGSSFALAGDALVGGALALHTGVGSIAVGGILVTPISYKGQILGVLTLASPHVLQDRGRSFADQLADQIGIAIQNARQYKQLHELTRQLNDRSRKIASQNVALERASRLKSEFLANMSHELRTPLSAIIGFSEVLRDGLVGGLNETQVDYCSEILSSGQHLLSLINEILDLSKVEAGKMELELGEVDVVALCTNALTIVKERAASGRVSLSSTVDPSLSSLVGDGRKLKQILYNLLSNAVKFTPEGGEVLLEARRLKSLDNHVVSFVVRDTGIGIAHEDQRLVFEPFKQIDGSAARKYAGTGLGLSLVKAMTELHGGQIVLQSELGKGSRFEITIPDQGALPSSTTASDAVPPLRSRPDAPLILIVDDDDTACTLYSFHLSGAGYRVVSATTADEGLASIAAQHPDLIVLDVLLPTRSGWEILRALKADPETAGIPVVLVSVIGDECQHKGFAMGAADVLTKPVSRELLLAAVERHYGSPSGALARILVIDEDALLAENIIGPLETKGFTVLRAGSAGDAMAQAFTHPPDIAIVDLSMPDNSGFEVIDFFKSQPSLRDLPILVVTAIDLDPATSLALRGKIRGLTHKRDFDAEALLRQVRALLGDPCAESADAAPAEKAEIGPDTKTVLVVGEDARDRTLLRRYIEEAGLQVVEAGDGREARAQLSAAPCVPDLVVLSPSEGDGMALIEEFSQPSQGGLPFLVLGGQGRPETRCAIGADMVLCKPIERDQLLSAAEALGVGVAEDEARILVVDDDPLAINWITSYLSQPCFDVTAAFGGREALSLAATKAFDLIILDLMMPEVNGFEVIDRLRQDVKTSSVPILVLTAKNLSHGERRRLEATVDHLAQKTELHGAALRHQIRALLGRRSRV